MPRTALVTGASSGIGAAAVRKLLSEGYTVVASGRDEARLKAAFADFADRNQIILVTADLLSESSIGDLVGTVAPLLGGRINVLVQNAGGYEI